MDDTFHQCFQKIHIKSKPSSIEERDDVLSEKIKLKTELKVYLDNAKCKLGLEIAQARLVKLEEEISEIISNRNAQIIKDQIRTLDTTDGKFSQLG